jgi:hypothetical protein
VWTIQPGAGSCCVGAWWCLLGAVVLRLMPSRAGAAAPADHACHIAAPWHSHTGV